MKKDKPVKLMGMPIVASAGVAPDELVLHGSRNSVRWTPDGGVEEMSDYQREQIAEVIGRSMKCNHTGPSCGPHCGWDRTK